MERLISAYPDNSLVLSLYGEIKLVLGKTAEAEEAINVAIGISPHNARMYYIKSRIALETEQIDIAEMNLRNAIQIDPVNADYFGALAYINIFRKNNEEALKYRYRYLQLRDTSELRLSHLCISEGGKNSVSTADHTGDSQ